VPFCEVRKLRDKLPQNGKLILAVHVLDGSLDPEPEEFYPLIDAILLDSRNRATNQVGGTGRIHDWATSAALVRRCPRPIVLAGGLTPDNVAEAVRTVRPFAVDANTGLKGEDGSRDPGKCLAFVANAKSAAATLPPPSPDKGE
jgi:phosphoribosylanthranilate isomerase